MDCTTARARLLEAEPHELRGEGDSDLASHLRGCAECRSRAESILGGYAELDTALRMIATPSLAAGVIPLRPRKPALRQWALPGGAAGLAAAAVIALLLARPEKPRTAPPTADQIAEALFPPAPTARAEGKSVAVLQTSDPGVTLVWVY